MLQKIVNGIAIASGVVSLTVVGLGGYVFVRKDAIIESVKEQAIDAALGALGGLGGGLAPDIEAPSLAPAPTAPTLPIGS